MSKRSFENHVYRLLLLSFVALPPGHFEWLSNSGPPPCDSKERWIDKGNMILTWLHRKMIVHDNGRMTFWSLALWWLGNVVRFEDLITLWCRRWKSQIRKHMDEGEKEREWERGHEETKPVDQNKRAATLCWTGTTENYKIVAHSARRFFFLSFFIC